MYEYIYSSCRCLSLCWRKGAHVFIMERLKVLAGARHSGKRVQEKKRRGQEKGGYSESLISLSSMLLLFDSFPRKYLLLSILKNNNEANSC